MGLTVERVAERCGITREDQDRFAARSQERCAAAQAGGRFAEVIVPVNGLEHDEAPRPGTTPAKLAGLKPAFLPQGSVTAANASGLNDGAAMLVLCDAERGRELGLEPLIVFAAAAAVGCDPATMGLGPIYAVRKVSAAPREFDLVELNEAFAAYSGFQGG